MINLKPFCEFTSLRETIPVGDFKIAQKELVARKPAPGNKHSFQVLDVVYGCSVEMQDNWNNSLPVIVVPIRDNPKLLKTTLGNFKENDVPKVCNIIVVDDRSAEDLKSIVMEYGFSYLRVDNDKGFNFSMLNNIAANIAYSRGAQTIIFWNSDLWCAKKGFLEELLERHHKSNSKLSGTKLVYPPKEISLSLTADDDNENIRTYFPLMSGGKWRNTVQFGGDCWHPSQASSAVILRPEHYLRFTDISDTRVNCDRGASFITGALQVWNLKHFVELGGLNPSLSKNYQDVDICLRSLASGTPPMYFGKDIYFYHDESFNMNNNQNEKKNDNQMLSDHILFGKIWNEKINALVYGAMEKKNEK